jgi:hypothetical protein
VGKRVAVVIKDQARQHEGVRLALGLLLDQHVVELYVVNQAIQLDDEQLENLAFIDEMGGARLSDVEANVTRYGFASVTQPEAAERLRRDDVVIPF